MQVVTFTDMPKLMLIYGMGFTGVFALFSIMYRYAWRHREALQLSAIEEIETQHSYRQYLGMVSVGGISALFALLGLLTHWPWFSFLSGIAYNLAIPFSFRLSRWRTNAIAAIEEKSKAH